MGAFSLGWQSADRDQQQRQQQKDEERQAQLQNLGNAGLSPEDMQTAIQAAYQKDPSALREHVQNLVSRMMGGKVPKYAPPVMGPAPTTTSQTPAMTLPDGTALPAGPTTTVTAPAPHTRQQVLADLAMKGKTWVQQQQEATEATSAAGNLAKRDQTRWQSDYDRQQAQQSVQDFSDTYKRMTGKEPSPSLLQAFTISALGGDKALSTMQQAETLKAREEYQNSTVQLRKSQQTLSQAKFDASQNPNNPMFRLRVQQAQTAAERAKSYWVSAQARVFGAVDGEPLPGAMLDAEDKPVGSEFQSNVRPTSTQRERATLATSAIEQMNDVLGTLKSRPGLFGPGGGQLTEINRWLGTSDPDAQRVRAAAGTAADHLAGVFGGRNQEALKFLHEVAGGNVTMNPRAMSAGIDQLQKAAKTIQSVGSYSTVGGGGNPTPTGSAPVNRGPAPKKKSGNDDSDLLTRLHQATSGEPQ